MCHTREYEHNQLHSLFQSSPSLFFLLPRLYTWAREAEGNVKTERNGACDAHVDTRWRDLCCSNNTPPRTNVNHTANNAVAAFVSCSGGAGARSCMYLSCPTQNSGPRGDPNLVRGRALPCAALIYSALYGKVSLLCRAYYAKYPYYIVL